MTLLLPGSAQGSILLELHTLGKGAASSQLLAWLRLPLSQLPSDRSGRQVAVQGLQLIWAQPAAGVDNVCKGCGSRLHYSQSD